MNRKATKSAKQKSKTDKVFGEIVAGLGEAIAYAEGKANPKGFRVTFRDGGRAAIRKRLKMSSRIPLPSISASAPRVCATGSRGVLSGSGRTRLPARHRGRA